MKFFLIAFACCAAAFGQGLDPATLLKRPADTWPTYNGDYSGRRFSDLDQINTSNVQNLALAWASRFTTTNGTVTIKATPLLVNGVLYFSSPNNVYAADVRTGRELWHYQYPQNTGSTIGNRGVAMYENWLFAEMPDSQLVSLDATTGKHQGYAIGNGILTVENEAQAVERCDPDRLDKGGGAARAAIALYQLRDKYAP